MFEVAGVALFLLFVESFRVGAVLFFRWGFFLEVEVCVVPWGDKCAGSEHVPLPREAFPSRRWGITTAPVLSKQKRRLLP